MPVIKDTPDDKIVWTDAKGARQKKPIIVSFFSYPDENGLPMLIDSRATYDGRVLFPGAPEAPDGFWFKAWVNRKSGKRVSEGTVFKDNTDVDALFEEIPVKYYGPRVAESVVNPFDDAMNFDDVLPPPAPNCLDEAIAKTLGAVIHSMGIQDNATGLFLSASSRLVNKVASDGVTDDDALAHFVNDVNSTAISLAKLGCITSNELCCITDALLFCDSEDACCANLAIGNVNGELITIVGAVARQEDSSASLLEAGDAVLTRLNDVDDTDKINKLVAPTTGLANTAAVIEESTSRKLCAVISTLCTCEDPVLAGAESVNAFNAIINSIAKGEAASGKLTETTSVIVDCVATKSKAGTSQIASMFSGMSSLMGHISTFVAAASKKLCCTLDIMCNGCKGGGCPCDGCRAIDCDQLVPQVPIGPVALP